MYCPRCAKEDLAGTKFCRDCGTDLETVVQALEGKLLPPAKVGQDSGDKSHGWDAPNKGWEDRYNNPQTTEDWLRKHGAGVNFMARGATLLVAVLLIGVIIFSLFGISFLPIVISAGIFGSLGLWGLAYLAEGLGAVLQSRSMLRGSEPKGIKLNANSPAGLSVTGDLRRISDVTIAPEPHHRSSVTEDTTARLDNQPRHG